MKKLLTLILLSTLLSCNTQVNDSEIIELLDSLSIVTQQVIDAKDSTINLLKEDRIHFYKYGYFKGVGATVQAVYNQNCIVDGKQANKSIQNQWQQDSIMFIETYY